MTKASFAVKQTMRAYELHRSTYIQEWDRRPYRLSRFLERWMEGLNPGSVLLDLGCGVGQDSRYLRRNRHGVVGTDLTWSFLRIAHRRSKRLPLVRADFHHLPFQEQSFDGIWAAASLIHCPSSRFSGVLRRLRRLLKPGGLLGTTLRYGSHSGYPMHQWIPGRYISEWRKPVIQKIFLQSGWRIVQNELVTNQERKGRWLNVIVQRV